MGGVRVRDWNSLELSESTKTKLNERGAWTRKPSACSKVSAGKKNGSCAQPWPLNQPIWWGGSIP